MTFQSNVCVSSSFAITNSLDYKYLNWLKGFSRVLSNGGPTSGSALWFDDTFLNADGNPLESTYGVNTTGDLIAGNYICRWDGTGSCVSGNNKFENKTNAASGSYTGGGADGSVVTNGRFKFSVSVESQSVGVTIKGPSISNVIICLDNGTDEALIDSGKLFRSAYLNVFKAQNPIIRHSLGPSDINASFLCKWEDRPLLTNLVYAGKFVFGKKCGTATGTNDYTLSTSNYVNPPSTPTHGTVAHFMVPAAQANTGACTLTFGSWPQKSFVSGYNSAMGAGSVTGPQIAMYDAVTDKWIQASNNTSSWYARFGVPYEAMIAECNESGLPGWISIPFFADDNHIDQFATLICTYRYLPSELYIEYGNEIWNQAFGFPFAQWAAAYGAAIFGLGPGNNAHISGWYSYRMAQIGARIRAIFANYPGVAPTLKLVLASQGASGDDVSTLTNVIENARFQNSSVPALSGANAPILSADVVSYALYFGGTVAPGTPDVNIIKNNLPYFSALKSMADSYASGDKNTAFNALRDDILSNISKAVTRFQNWNTLAAKYGKPIKMYEFCWEMGYPSTATATGASIILYSPSNQIVTTNATSAVNALGFLINGTTQGGGTTINSSGLFGAPKFNKAGAAITSSTLLSGSAGSDSITTSFAAGNTITIGSTTITFVASGATGNQLNITDSIGSLLSKIDSITGTGTPSIVRAPIFDVSYANNGGIIDLMLKEFYASSQAGQVITRFVSEFKKLSQSSGMAISAGPGAYPYLSFTPSPLTDAGARITGNPNSLWQIMQLANTGKTRLFAKA